MHSQRKLDHLLICLEKDVQFRGVSNGLASYRFLHQALPEMAKEEIDTSMEFLGRRQKSPFIISAMTGGTAMAEKINRNLALAAQKASIAMCVGSQRAGVEDASLAYSYQVRELAPDITLLANLGAVQLNYGYGLEKCLEAVNMIQADGLILHLNPLQECLQPQGNTNFGGLLAKIKELSAALPVPIIVKEVGCGISKEVALKLNQAGVFGIDVAGAGGTSWALVERHRGLTEEQRNIAQTFIDWGIPTAESIIMAREVDPNWLVIASGGIRSGIEAAKSISLGANAVGIASPLLKPAAESSEAAERYLEQLVEELRITMFCVGAKDIPALKKIKLIKS